MGRSGDLDGKKKFWSGQKKKVMNCMKFGKNTLQLRKAVPEHVQSKLVSNRLPNYEKRDVEETANEGNLLQIETVLQRKVDKYVDDNAEEKQNERGRRVDSSCAQAPVTTAVQEGLCHSRAVNESQGNDLALAKAQYRDELAEVLTRPEESNSLQFTTATRNCTLARSCSEAGIAPHHTALQYSYTRSNERFKYGLNGHSMTPALSKKERTLQR